MHKERVYLFPMHLSKALPQARKNAQGIIHPRAGVLTHCAVLAKIVVVFWINGYPPQFHNGISPPPFPEAWSSSAITDSTAHIISYFHQHPIPDSKVLINGDKTK